MARSTNLKLNKPATTSRNWDTPINENSDALDALKPVSELAVTLSEIPSTTLNVDVATGSFISADRTLVAYAGVTGQAITTATTKYLYLTNAGTLTIGSAWPTSGFYVPLAVVVAGATTITSITDARRAFRTVSGGALSGSATLVGGAVTVTTAAVAAGSKIVVSRMTTGGTAGHLSIGTITAATSFVINSSSGSDTSTVYWRIEE